MPYNNVVAFSGNTEHVPLATTHVCVSLIRTPLLQVRKDLKEASRRLRQREAPGWTTQPLQYIGRTLSDGNDPTDSTYREFHGAILTILSELYKGINWDLEIARHPRDERPERYAKLAGDVNVLLSYVENALKLKQRDVQERPITRSDLRALILTGWLPPAQEYSCVVTPNIETILPEWTQLAAKYLTYNACNRSKHKHVYRRAAIRVKVHRSHVLNCHIVPALHGVAGYLVFEGDGSSMRNVVYFPSSSGLPPRADLTSKDGLRYATELSDEFEKAQFEQTTTKHAFANAKLTDRDENYYINRNNRRRWLVFEENLPKIVRISGDYDDSNVGVEYWTDNEP